MKFLFVLLFCTHFASGFAQQMVDDQLLLVASAQKGVYLDFDQFKSNSPITLERIKNGNGFADEKYLYALKKSQSIRYHDQYGIQRSIPGTDIWGYCTGDDIYINLGIGYSKIQIIGSISYFMADVLVELPPMTASFSTGPATVSSQPRYSNEKLQFIMDAQNGAVLEATAKNLLLFLQSDTVLHASYDDLKSKEQNKRIIPTITQYNQNHPFQFAK